MAEMDGDDPKDATVTTVTFREHAGVTTMVMAGLCLEGDAE